MALKKLTKQAVDRTEVGTVDVFLWDTELKGFGCKVTPKGRRVFIFQYWAPHLHRTRRRITLGTFGPLTVDHARAAATRLSGRVAAGEDPADEVAHDRRNTKDATVYVLHSVYLDERQSKIKVSTAHEYKRLFDSYILPALGKHPIAQLAVREIVAIHTAHRKHPYQANRVLFLLSAFLTWAERRGYRDRNTNPCRDVEPFPEYSRERFLTVEEVGRLGIALTTAATVGLLPAPEHRRKPSRMTTAKHRPKSANNTIPANPYVVAAIRFLVLSGWRESEALTLRWNEVNLERGLATLPNTKTGKSHRPLGASALALLAELPRLHGSPFVFPGARPGQPLREIRRTWYAVRFAAQLEDVRLHDLRHTVASFSVGSGHSLYLTGMLLGHTRSETTQRYAHLQLDVRQTVANTVSGALDAALRGQSTPVTLIKAMK